LIDWNFLLHIPNYLVWGMGELARIMLNGLAKLYPQSESIVNLGTRMDGIWDKLNSMIRELEEEKAEELCLS